MHVHVEKGDSVAKFWLEPVELANSYGFNATEINEIRKLVSTHRSTFTTAWHEHFD